MSLHDRTPTARGWISGTGTSLHAGGALGRGVGQNLPCAALGGSSLEQLFRYWKGGSGSRYLFSVTRVESDQHRRETVLRFTDAVVIAVNRQRDGSLRPVWIGDTDACPDLVFGGSTMDGFVDMGVNEIHTHLLASGHDQRHSIVTDLHRAWNVHAARS